MTQQPNDEPLPLIDYRVWDGTVDGAIEVMAWIDPTVIAYLQEETPPLEDMLVVTTIDGNARARKNDYIVLTEEGYRPMKRVIFRQTYPEAQ